MKLTQARAKPLEAGEESPEALPVRLPVTLAVMVPAEKFPEESRSTIVGGLRMIVPVAGVAGVPVTAMVIVLDVGTDTTENPPLYSG